MVGSYSMAAIVRQYGGARRSGSPSPPSTEPIGARRASNTDAGEDAWRGEAFRDATANMAAWLTDQYQLTPSEVAQVLGTAAEYRVTEVADRNAGIVLGIRKDRLRALSGRAR